MHARSACACEPHCPAVDQLLPPVCMIGSLIGGSVDKTCRTTIMLVGGNVRLVFGEIHRGHNFPDHVLPDQNAAVCI